MPKFRFVAMDAKGRETDGVIEAESQTRAISMVREKGMFPTSVVEMGARQKAAQPGTGAPAGARARGGMKVEIKLPKFLDTLMSGRVKTGQLTVFTRQLATLLDAGLPLLRGLHILQKQEGNAALRNAVNAMAESVEGGSTFAEALSQQPKIFNKFFVNMVRAGEAGGALETVLLRLADFMEKGQRVKNKVRGALIYPIVVMIMAVAILGFMLVVVIPKFEDIFGELLGEGQLPALTRFVMALSKNVAGNGIGFVLGVVAIVIAIRLIGATTKGKFVLDSIKLRAPLFGSLIRKSTIATFARTLGTLLTGGVPMLQALNIVKEIAGNQVISSSIGHVHDAVKEGETMVTPLEASRVFPSMVIGMVQVGEETGALPDMLMKVADTYDDEVDTAVEALTSIIEPILIIMLAVVVGTIVIAMFLPLVDIINRMSQ